jgi:hypothetical protein
VLLNFVVAPSTLVTAEEPVQFLIPIGPSAILIAGIPSLGMGVLSIQPDPLNIAAFSSSVIRPSRSDTLCFTANLGFL